MACGAGVIMAGECTCENGKKREAQLLDVLLANLAKGSPLADSTNLHQIIFGPDGEIDKGLLGKIHNMDLGLTELKSGQASMRNWLKTWVVVNVLLMSILIAHLSDAPKTALAETPEPVGIEQPVTEGNTDGIKGITIRPRG